MLGVLRRVDEDLRAPPVAGLAGLDELAERVRVGGTPVRLHRSGPTGRCPPPWTPPRFRIVQEALDQRAPARRTGHATVLVTTPGPTW